MQGISEAGPEGLRTGGDARARGDFCVCVCVRVSVCVSVFCAGVWCVFCSFARRPFLFALLRGACVLMISFSSGVSFPLWNGCVSLCSNGRILPFFCFVLFGFSSAVPYAFFKRAYLCSVSAVFFFMCFYVSLFFTTPVSVCCFQLCFPSKQLDLYSTAALSPWS